MKITSRDITTVALFTAAISILAQFSIPLPLTPVPLTGQMIGVFLAGALLGGRKGALAVLAYTLLGATGLPVFAMGRGGLQVLLGPTGGYLLGFIPGAYLLGKISEKYGNQSYASLLVGMLACLALSYLPGCLYLSRLMQLSLAETLLVGAAPYLLPDLAKIAITIPVVRGVSRTMGASPVTGET